MELQMKLQRIVELWHEHYSIPWWQALLFCIAFSVVNLGLFICVWVMRERVIIEFNRQNNTKNYRKLEKKIKSFTLFERLLLINTTKAGKMGFLPILNLLCHWMSILAVLLSVIGFWGVILTHIDGWAFILFAFPVGLVTAFTAIVEAIPHLIWLPSVRRMYRLK